MVLFNEGAELLLGYRADEVIGKRLSDLYGSEERVREVYARCASAAALPRPSTAR